MSGLEVVLAVAALLIGLVPREVFPRAVTVASTVQALAFATGPAVGGMLIAWGGVASLYGAYGLLVCGSFAGLGVLRPARQETVARGLSLRAIGEGLSFVRRSQVVLGCMTSTSSP